MFFFTCMYRNMLKTHKKQNFSGSTDPKCAEDLKQQEIHDLEERMKHVSINQRGAFQTNGTLFTVD